MNWISWFSVSILMQWVIEPTSRDTWCVRIDTLMSCFMALECAKARFRDKVTKLWILQVREGVFTTEDISDHIVKNHSKPGWFTHSSVGSAHYCTYEDCGQRCIDFSSLRVHMRKHFNIRPFQCTYCSYKSARKYDTLKHIQIMHRDRW